MYKVFLLVILVIIGAISAASVSPNPIKTFQHLNSAWDQNRVGLDLCSECIEESVTVINILLNLVLDEGIVGSCTLLCDALGNKTHSNVTRDLCEAVCEAYGIDEFVKALVNDDLDPIWYCELLDICPINDHGDGKFSNFSISPLSAPEGATFIFDCSFISVNGTGTGTIVLDFIDPKNRTFENLYWFEARKPGTYVEKLPFDTLHELGCDPTKGVCEGWPIGTYNVTARVCNGECGSKHPHSSIYDTARGSFEITKKKDA